MKLFQAIQPASSGLALRRMSLLLLVCAFAAPAWSQASGSPVSGLTAFEVQAKKKGKKGTKKKNAGKKASSAKQS